MLLDRRLRTCGSRGTQLLRLFDALAAMLFFVQFTGRISEMVIKDMEGIVAALRPRSTSVP